MILKTDVPFAALVVDISSLQPPVLIKYRDHGFKVTFAVVRNCCGATRHLAAPPSGSGLQWLGGQVDTKAGTKAGTKAAPRHTGMRNANEAISQHLSTLLSTTLRGYVIICSPPRGGSGNP